MDPQKTGSPVRILIVDDHALFRQGVRTIVSQSPDLVVVGEAEDGETAVDRFNQLRPDVVIMDINMPRMNGLEATRQIKRIDPDAHILILTVTDAEEFLFESVKAGASGYVLKTAAPSVVLDSLRRISSGEPVIPGNLAVRIIHEMSKQSDRRSHGDIDTLTDREVEVLRQLSTGASNREIAAALFISENTVRNHVRNILDKLHVRNRGQAAAFAMRQGYTLDAEREPGS